MAFLAAKSWIASRIFSLLRISRDISIYPQISSDHLGIHCLISPDYIIALSWKFLPGCHIASPGVGVPEVLLHMKTGLWSLGLRTKGFVSGPQTSLPEEARDKLWSWTHEYGSWVSLHPNLSCPLGRLNLEASAQTQTHRDEAPIKRPYLLTCSRTLPICLNVYTV